MGEAISNFPDQNEDFQAQAAKLARRRKLAEQLVQQGMQNDTGSGYQGGKVYIVGNALGPVAQSIGGTILNRMADNDQADLTQRQRQAEQDTLASIPAEPGPDRQQAQLRALQQMPSLRDAIKAQMGFDTEEANRIEKGEQLAEDRVARSQEAEANRIERGEQQAADRVARQDLRSMPTIHITNSGGGNASPFAGPATQAGIDPRDEMPVYRVSKTGELFKYGENGPVAHTGAVAPKPAAAKEPTESERSSAGYLGRMEAAEQNLTGAEPLPYLQQRGLEKAPGLTNFSLSQKQQVTRQQQEDWVRAKLRKESGAVIGDEEMAREIRTYFPQAGDGPDVIKQKAQSRAQALEQMRSSAGRSKPTQAPPVSGERKTINGKTYEKRGGQWYPL